MSPKRKGGKPVKSSPTKKKEEVLPVLNTLEDGPCDYYIGGFSSVKFLPAALTTFSEKFKPPTEAAEAPYLAMATAGTSGAGISPMSGSAAANEAAAREGVADAKLHQVYLLKGVAVEEKDDNERDGDSLHKVVLTHGIRISGLRGEVSKNANVAFNKRMEEERKIKEAREVASGATIKQSDAEHPESPTQGDNRAAAAEGDEPLAEEPPHPRYELLIDEEEEELDEAAVEDERRRALPKRHRPVRWINTEEVITIEGELLLEGIRPKATVKAADVTPAQLQAGVMAAGILPQEGKGGKPKKRTKEEETRELIILNTLKEENALVAQKDSERLSLFAIPERWPTVTFVDISFEGLLEIKQCHLQFLNCNFSFRFDENKQKTQQNVNTNDKERDLVIIHQYCHIEFNNCSFVGPRRCAVYAFPTAEVTFFKCLFSAVSLPKTHQEGKERSFLTPQEVKAEVEKAAVSRPNSVGIHADCARLFVKNCHFEGLTFGIVVRGSIKARGAKPSAAEGGYGAKNIGEQQQSLFNTLGEYVYEINEEGYVMIPRKPAVSFISGCAFVSCIGTAVTLVGSSKLTVRACSFVGSGYYDLQCMNSGCTPLVTSCIFNGRVKIGKKAMPIFKENKVKTPMINENGYEPTYMKVHY